MEKKSASLSASRLPQKKQKNEKTKKNSRKLKTFFKEINKNLIHISSLCTSYINSLNEENCLRRNCNTNKRK